MPEGPIPQPGSRTDEPLVHPERSDRMTRPGPDERHSDDDLRHDHTTRTRSVPTPCPAHAARGTRHRRPTGRSLRRRPSDGDLPTGNDDQSRRDPGAGVCGHRCHVLLPGRAAAGTVLTRPVSLPTQTTYRMIDDPSGPDDHESSLWKHCSVSSRPSPSELVGRLKELDVLEDALRSTTAADSRVACVLIGGDAGIGKTAPGGRIPVAGTFSRGAGGHRCLHPHQRRRPPLRSVRRHPAGPGPPTRPRERGTVSSGRPSAASAWTFPGFDHPDPPADGRVPPPPPTRSGRPGSSRHCLPASRTCPSWCPSCSSSRTCTGRIRPLPSCSTS